MKAPEWTIYWTEYASDTYLFGLELDYRDKKNVTLTNHMLPPGTVIKTWYSRTNFQKQKIEPALPLIDGEREYRLTARIEGENGKKDGWLLRLVFFDRYDKEVGHFITGDRVSRFRCPLSTYSYQLQLLNGGASRIVFHSVTLTEEANDTDKTAEKTE